MNNIVGHNILNRKKDSVVHKAFQREGKWHVKTILFLFKRLKVLQRRYNAQFYTPILIIYQFSAHYKQLFLREKKNPQTQVEYKQ